jgi:O-antigen ligase
VTHAPEQIDLLSPWWLASLALACVVTGVLAGIDPLYGLLAASGVTFAVIVIVDLTVGVVLFTSLSFLDLLSSSGSFSGTKLIGVVLFLSWLAHVATRPRAGLGSFTRSNPGLVVALVAMLGWCALSFAWAYSPSTALAGAGRYALDMSLFPIMFAAVRERKHVIWVVTAFIAGAVFSCVYGFLDPASHAAGRQTGSFGDPNAEGTVLAATIPMLIAMAGVVRDSARLRLVAAIGVFIMFAGLVDTLSREALLALGAAMVAAVIFGGRWRVQARRLLVVGVLATCGYYFVLAPLTSRERVTSADTSGRSSIWAVAWRIVDDHPVLGVGNDNFILVEGQYLNQPGAIAATYIIVVPRVAHNAFLEALTDLGIPGLLTLLAVLGCCIRAVVRATWIFERLGDDQMELISRAVLWALVALLTSNLFVSGEYAKYLWIPLALCPALLALARRTEAQERGVPAHQAAA